MLGRVFGVNGLFIGGQACCMERDRGHDGEEEWFHGI